MSVTETLRALTDGAEPGELPALAGDLAHALGTVITRMAEVRAIPDNPTPHGEADGLLTVAEAAARLGVARSWLYRHAKALPFARKLGYRTLRFDPRGLEKWSATRSGR